MNNRHLNNLLFLLVAALVHSKLAPGKKEKAPQNQNQMGEVKNEAPKGQGNKMGGAMNPTDLSEGQKLEKEFEVEED